MNKLWGGNSPLPKPINVRLMLRVLKESKQYLWDGVEPLGSPMKPPYITVCLCAREAGAMLDIQYGGPQTYSPAAYDIRKWIWTKLGGGLTIEAWLKEEHNLVLTKPEMQAYRRQWTDMLIAELQAIIDAEAAALDERFVLAA